MCLSPYYVKSHDYFAPCGQCPWCRKQRVSQWTIRLLDEYTTCKGRASFITLTYDNEHLSRYSLDHRHVQLYLKRIRRYTQLKLRYYVAGEYGPESARPHYHMILYGIGPAEYLSVMSLGEVTRKDLSITVLDRCWTYGTVTVGMDCSDRALRYTAKYINKIEYGVAKYNKYYGRKPPYQTCSKSMGLEYMLANAEQYKEDKYVIRGDIKLGLPKYYKQKLGLDVSDYKRQINKKNNDIITILRDQYGCDNPIETDPNLIDIYNRNPQDAPHSLTYHLDTDSPLLDITKSYSNYENKCDKKLKKYLTVSANIIYNTYKRLIARSILSRNALNDHSTI